MLQQKSNVQTLKIFILNCNIYQDPFLSNRWQCSISLLACIVQRENALRLFRPANLLSHHKYPPYHKIIFQFLYSSRCLIAIHVWSLPRTHVQYHLTDLSDPFPLFLSLCPYPRSILFDYFSDVELDDDDDAFLSLHRLNWFISERGPKESR